MTMLRPPPRAQRVLGKEVGKVRGVSRQERGMPRRSARLPC